MKNILLPLAALVLLTGCEQKWSVEEQYEDLPFDMVCYKDADGNTYDFGYGLNWSGVISDARTKKYTKK